MVGVVDEEHVCRTSFTETNKLFVLIITNRDQSIPESAPLIHTNIKRINQNEKYGAY